MAESRRSGQSLDRRFTLIRRLGEGGMGEVWLARDERSGREVALKFLPSDTSSAGLARLEVEFDSLNRLAHPNIVPVLGFHRTSAGPVLVMEPILGPDIGSLRGRSPAEIVEALIPLADALAYAHEMGVVHRDLKPSNVLMDGGGTPRLVDFGIAGTLANAGASGQKATPTGAGDGASRWYASPEQIAGEPPRTTDDAWALGVLLHVLIAGFPPGAEDTLESPWPLPDDLRGLVSALTAPAPEDRVSDMNEVRRRLEEIHARSLVSPATPPRSVELAAPPPRLIPPPRAETLRPVAPSRSAARDAPEPAVRWARWGTRAAFGLLALGAVFVFLLLPDWVEHREPPATEKATTVSDPKGEVERTANEVGVDRTTAERLAAEERPTVEAPPEPPAEPPRAPRAPEPTQPDLPTRSAARPVGGFSSAPRLSPFEAAMSEGLAAIEQGDPGAARVAFGRAVELDAESGAAREGLAQAEKAFQLEVTRGLRQSAEEHETAERWSDALADYEAILELDPALEFAMDGRARSRERAELATGLAHHLSRPRGLSSEETRRKAKDLVARTRRLEPPAVGLEGEAARLAHQIDVYSTPVPVTLLSDDLTNVTIYRVGRQGTFTRKELRLPPGTYTVVGSRAGYRDVRARLEIPPGEQPAPLTVRCEERI